MRYALAKEHILFFQEQGFVEFEEVFSPDEIKSIQKEINVVLAKRKTEPSSDFLQGRDLWRDSHTLFHLEANKNLASIAKELFGQKILRLAFDQYLPLPRKEGLYGELLNKNLSVSELSSIEGVVGGFFLHLGEELSESLFFPKKPGNLVFFGPHTTFPFPYLESPLLTVVFAGRTAKYILSPHDPQAHFLKHYGVIPGETLKDHILPVILR